MNKLKSSFPHTLNAHTKLYKRACVLMIAKKAAGSQLKEISEKYEGAEDFTDNIIDENCSQKKFSAEEVIYFLFTFLQFMFRC